MDNHQLGGAHQRSRSKWKGTRKKKKSSMGSKNCLCCQRPRPCWETNQGEQSVIMHASTNWIWKPITQISLKHKRSIKNWLSRTRLTFWRHVHVDSESTRRRQQRFHMYQMRGEADVSLQKQKQNDLIVCYVWEKVTLCLNFNQIMTAPRNDPLCIFFFFSKMCNLKGRY